MSVSDRVDSSRGKLADLSYEMRADDLVRFRADPTDDAVAGIIRTVTAEGGPACEDFRRRLGDAELQTLRQFAVRRTVLARRQSSMSPIYESLDAFALLPKVEDVSWDSWVKADLFIARSQGGDADLLDRRFQEVASEDAVARWHVALEAMNRVESLAQCRVAEVTTSYGVGLLEMLNFSDSPGGFYGAPTLGFTPTYHPTTNLAQLAVTLADALDSTSTVLTGPIGQDQLAASSFSMTTSGSYLETEGCLSFVAQSVDHGPSYTVYMAEVSDDTDVGELTDAASTLEGQAAVSDARRLVLVAAQPNFDLGEDEVDIVDDDRANQRDFLRVVELGRAALADPATQ
jgi:hypothetical protein